MSISLPRDISALMTLTVSWRASAAAGPDGYGQFTYAPAVDLSCWIEPHGISGAGETAMRRADGTVVEPQVDLYFSGDNPLARQIKLWDQFVAPGVGTIGEILQAVRVETQYGPNFDNRNPWLIIITL